MGTSDENLCINSHYPEKPAPIIGSIVALLKDAQSGGVELGLIEVVVHVRYCE